MGLSHNEKKKITIACTMAFSGLIAYFCYRKYKKENSYTPQISTDKLKPRIKKPKPLKKHKEKVSINSIKVEYGKTPKDTKHVKKISNNKEEINIIPKPVMTLILPTEPKSKKEPHKDYAIKILNYLDSLDNETINTPPESEPKNNDTETQEIPENNQTNRTTNDDNPIILMAKNSL